MASIDDQLDVQDCRCLRVVGSHCPSGGILFGYMRGKELGPVPTRLQVGVPDGPPIGDQGL